jgi:hypothetical protein
MPKNEGYKHNWVLPLLPFLKHQSAPIAPIDEQTLERILTRVGQRFVPADLDRARLRSAIAKAVETKEQIDKIRPGKYSRALGKGVKRIRQATGKLDECLRKNNDAWQLIADYVPSFSEDVIRVICTAQAIEQNLAESAEHTIASYSPRVPNAREWLAGVELPLVFEEFFHRKGGRSRSGGKPAGPTVRFVHAVMTETCTSFAEESILRAMTGLAELRKRRRAVRKRENPDIGQN